MSSNEGVEAEGKDVPGKNAGSGSELRDAVDETIEEYPSLRAVKKTVVAAIGGTVLLIGVFLLVLPGPAFLVIPAGLAILALEFRWARRWLRKATAMLSKDKSGPSSKETNDN